MPGILYPWDNPSSMGTGIGCLVPDNSRALPKQSFVRSAIDHPSNRNRRVPCNLSTKESQGPDRNRAGAHSTNTGPPGASFSTLSRSPCLHLPPSTMAIIPPPSSPRRPSTDQQDTFSQTSPTSEHVVEDFGDVPVGPPPCRYGAAVYTEYRG